jgi:glycosyltransferase involved in cell wall biosynthesis
MMRPGDKMASYRMLAGALRSLMDISWHLVIAGDGAGRSEVEKFMEAAVPGRTRFLGERSAEDLAKIYAACDLSVWPAVNEAYGMAMLEAQAAGVPVISRSQRGVPDVVSDGRTGLLATADDAGALSELTRALLTDVTRRRRLGQEAARYVATERSIDSAAHKLSRLLDGIGMFGAGNGEREVKR